MQQNTSTTTRIAKNAVTLYFRSFIVMAVSFYTSRVILRVLGVEDLGVYNAVGGIVVLFAFLDGGQSATYQRFYNYAMGRPDEYNLKDVFSSSIVVQMLIAAGVFIVTEIVGIFLLYNVLVIPDDRLIAAFWVFQFSVLTLIVNTLSIPYNAMIVAKEDMGAFAYIDIANVVLKLLIVFNVEYSSFDRLIFYAFLLLCVQLVTRFLYTSFCKRKYKDSHFNISWNRKLIREMMGFSSWIVLSSIASILMNQGISILFNIFYGVVANAAIGISSQVRSAIVKLTGNMTFSFSPQIVLNYSNGEWCKVDKIWTVGTKCAVAMFAALSVPVIIDADYILKIWLENPPMYTTIFLQLILIENLIRFFSANASTIIRATGHIKKYELITNVINAIAFIAICIGLNISDNVALPFIILIVTTTIQVIYSIYCACFCIQSKLSGYLLTNTGLSAVSLMIAILIGILLRPMEMSIISLLIHSFVIITVMVLSFYLIGFLPSERVYLNKVVIGIYHKVIKR